MKLSEAIAQVGESHRAEEPSSSRVEIYERIGMAVSLYFLTYGVMPDVSELKC